MIHLVLVIISAYLLFVFGLYAVMLIIGVPLAIITSLIGKK